MLGMPPRRIADRIASAPTRRFVLAGAGALAACGGPSPKPGGGKPMTIEQAVGGEWRTDADKARNAWRHPAQTLGFFGLQPGATVVEFWPGAGWYTDIIAPFLAATGGKLYAATLQAADPNDPSAADMDGAFRRKIRSRPRLYGDVEITSFGPTSGPVAPAGTADLALTFRNLHNWMAAGIAEKAFHDAFEALKPGGVFGLVEHRADAGAVPDVLAQSGYVQQDVVIQMGREAGFVFQEASDINANPKDTKDHPFGVWTLPPVRRSSPRGQPPDPDFDHSKYDAIGESDRMTLKFAKPS